MAKTVTALEDLYPPGAVPGTRHWARAHAKGEVIPVETDEDRQRIEDNGWGDLVQGSETKAAKKAVDESVKGA